MFHKKASWAFEIKTNSTQQVAGLALPTPRPAVVQ